MSGEGGVQDIVDCAVPDTHPCAWCGNPAIRGQGLTHVNLHGDALVSLRLCRECGIALLRFMTHMERRAGQGTRCQRCGAEFVPEFPVMVLCRPCTDLLTKPLRDGARAGEGEG